MGNSAKFMLVGILVVVLLIAMIWDRSNEKVNEGRTTRTYPLADAIDTRGEQTSISLGGAFESGAYREENVASGIIGDNPGPSFSDEIALGPELDFGPRATFEEPRTESVINPQTPGVEPPLPPIAEEITPAVPSTPQAEVSPTRKVSTKTYTTTATDTYWSIAEKFYGSGAKWQIIRDANMDVCPDPARMRAGLKLTIPEAVSRPTTPQQTGTIQTAADGKTYIVQKGDTLWSIAVKHYGNGMKYKDIFKANSNTLGSENATLTVGAKILLP